MRSFVLDYQDISQWCSSVFVGMRKTRIQNFSSLVYGLVSSSTATCASAARNMGNGKSFTTNRQRIRRFMKEKNITLSEIGSALIPLVLSRFPKNQILSLILDTTSLVGDEVQCLTAAIAWKGRALPIGAKLYRHTRIPDSQNKIEEAFIRWLIRHIPKGYRVCIVADRGFGRVDLMRLCQDLHVDYCIRVKNHVTIEDELGKKGLLSKRWCKLGTAKLLPNIMYRADAAVTTNIVITRSPGAKETWYLATSLTSATEAKQRYEQRFQIEETFKDAKRVLGLEYTTLSSLRRVGKLVAAVLTAVLILLFLGSKSTKYRTLMDKKEELSALLFARTLLTWPPPQFRRVCMQTLRLLVGGRKV